MKKLVLYFFVFSVLISSAYAVNWNVDLADETDESFWEIAFTPEEVVLEFEGNATYANDSNYSLFANSSDFWDDLDTPMDIEQMNEVNMSSLTSYEIGVNVSAINYPLDVYGNTRILGNIYSQAINDTARLVLEGYGDAFNFGSVILRNRVDNHAWYLLGKVGTNNFAIQNYDGSDYDTFFTITEDGYTGINTSVPDQALEVQGNSKVYDGEMSSQVRTNTNSQGMVFQNSGGALTWRMFRRDAGSSYADLVFSEGLETSFEDLTPRVIFKRGGNVGIGTNDTPEKLNINGSIAFTNGQTIDSSQNGRLIFKDMIDLASADLRVDNTYGIDCFVSGGNCKVEIENTDGTGKTNLEVEGNISSNHLNLTTGAFQTQLNIRPGGGNAMGISFSTANMFTNWSIGTQGSGHFFIDRDWDGSIDNTNWITINKNSGNIGINQTYPAMQLDVQVKNPGMRYYNTETAESAFFGCGALDRGVVIGTSTNNNISFAASIDGTNISSGYRMAKLTNGGWFGLGVNRDPIAPLTIFNNIEPQVVIRTMTFSEAQMKLISNRNVAAIHQTMIEFANNDSNHPTDPGEFTMARLVSRQEGNDDHTAFFKIEIANGSDDEIDRLHITSEGYVGINTSSPTYTLEVDGDAYIERNITADNFVDHTPAWSGSSREALEELSQTTKTVDLSSGRYELDHESMPDFTKATISVTKVLNCSEEFVIEDAWNNYTQEVCTYETYESEGRNIGATVTMQTESVIALYDMVDSMNTTITGQETKIDTLETTVETQESQIADLEDALCTLNSTFSFCLTSGGTGR